MNLIRTLKILMISLVASCTMIQAQDSLDSTTLGEVTITANKIEENIQDVPQSITVIDEEMIEQKGIKTIDDVLKEIPNMKGLSEPGHGYLVNFRGINSSVFTNNNPVVIYIDGVPTTDRYDYKASLANVERIEVLRGPQGTLYGKDAIGAVINIVTKKPKNYASGSINFEYASYNYTLGKFNINTPLINDKLYFGLNGEFISSDGWIKNENINLPEDAAKYSDKMLSTYFLYNITDALSSKLILSYNKNEENWQKGYSQALNTPLSQYKRDEAKHVNFDVPTIENTTTSTQALSFKYELDNITVNLATTHKNFKLDGIYDTDQMNDPLYSGLSLFDNTQSEMFTQELRVSSSQDQDIRWVSGLYFDKENREQGPYGYETLYYGSKYDSDARSDSNSETRAIFGQTMIDLSDDFELTIGARYQKIKKDIDLKTYTKFGTNPTTIYLMNGEKTWNTFLPKAALSYKLNNNLTSYASFSKGYMPGGFNYFAMSGTSEDNSFKPQQSTNYELGLKGSYDDFIFTASIFRMNIKDIQIYKKIGSIYISDNAKKAHSQGIEFDFTYFLSDNIQIDGSFGFIDAKYDDYDIGVTNFNGKRIEKTAKYGANLGISYNTDEGYYSRLDLKRQGSMNFLDSSSNELRETKSYNLINLKIGYEFDDWNVYTYVNNVTNEEYIESFKTNVNATVTFGDPRTFGLGLRYKF